MATPKHQRVFIWVIALVMAVGTIGTFATIILANNNGAVPPSEAALQKQQEEYDKWLEEYEKQAETEAKARAASAQPLDGFQAEPFDAASVTELQKTDLVVGEGEEVPTGATVTVSYTGWLPDGTIFDSTRRDGTNTPAEGFTLQEGRFIKGWIEGVPGMKVGGVRKLVIPAELAYGESGKSPLIAPNTPLAFLVRVESVDQ